MRGRIYGHYRTEDHENCAGGGKAHFASRFYRILSYFREQWLPATPWLAEKLCLSAGSVADACSWSCCAAGGEDQRRWQDDGDKRIKVYQKIAAAKRTSPRQFFGWSDAYCAVRTVLSAAGVSVRLPQPHRESAAVSTVSSSAARFFMKSLTRHVLFIHTFSVTETAVFCQERLRLSFF